MHTSFLTAASLRRTVSVAVPFWALCLGLGVLEATLGENRAGSVLFLLSVPALVCGLFWANRALLRGRPRSVALITLSVAVLVYATVILLLGLLAASTLESLLLTL